jgi:hypothetical protein
MVGAAAKRERVAHLQAVMGLSERRACSIIGARKMIRYRSWPAAGHGAGRDADCTAVTRPDTMQTHA